MGKNIIPGIAKMLGVKIGEEFKVNSLYEQMIFKFADNELLGRIDVEGSIWTPAYVVLSNLLGGGVEIIKLSWKPKKNDTFYTFGFTYGKWGVKPDMWAGAPCDYALLGKGWVYRTRAEAEAALPVVAAKLGVKYAI